MPDFGEALDDLEEVEVDIIKMTPRDMVAALDVEVHGLHLHLTREAAENELKRGTIGVSHAMIVDPNQPYYYSAPLLALFLESMAGEYAGPCLRAFLQTRHRERLTCHHHRCAALSIRQQSCPSVVILCMSIVCKSPLDRLHRHPLHRHRHHLHPLHRHHVALALIWRPAFRLA